MGRPPPGGPARFRSEARRVADDEARCRGSGQVPARTGSLFVADGVPAQAGDLGEGVAGVGIDGDPLSRPWRAPVLELPRGQRARDQAAAEEGEADRAGAVVAARVEGAVAAAPYIGTADDRVGSVD